MATEIVALFKEPLLAVWTKFMNIVPNILASLVFLLIGLYLSRAAKMLAVKILSKFRLDESTSRFGINEILTRVGFGKSPTNVISYAVYWMIMLVFFSLAAGALKLDAITVLLNRLIAFIPSLAVSIIIVFGGLLFARFVRQIVENSATANNVPGGNALAKLVYVSIIMFAIQMALEQLQIATTIINYLIITVLASVGLGVALAVGLGAKDSVARLLENYSADHAKK
ncbi:MAG: hypothetical protein PHW69_00755 [Elusimicrobiaceae bacterium]|nr:hypothetical protein [Elusimicrobiaceae bacterium]